MEFIDQGEQIVKNIGQPVRVYLVNWSLPPATTPSSASGPIMPLGRSSKPSVAVLPFSNMSNDPEQEYFSDGITEDIITDLAKVSGLFVLGRNTVFTYKGKAVHLPRIAKELGVSYLLEGSVRKAGHRIRINAQLIDGTTGGHIWAERYDGDLSDVFTLQDEITLKIVDALKVRLLPAETSAIKATPTGNIEAYTFCLRGRELLNMHFPRYYPMAREMFVKAVELDPSFAAAYAGIADSNSYLFLIRKDQTTIASMLENSARALALDPILLRLMLLGGWPSGAPRDRRRLKRNIGKRWRSTPPCTRPIISMVDYVGRSAGSREQSNCSNVQLRCDRPTTNPSGSCKAPMSFWAGGRCGQSRPSMFGAGRT